MSELSQPLPIEEQDVIYQLATFESPQRTLFACRTSGLYTSPDGGKTWQYAYQSLLGDTPLATLCIAGASGPDGYLWLFAGVPGGVMRSKDAGQHWEAVLFAEPAPLVLGLVVSPLFQTEGILLAATARDGVFASLDYGQHWEAWNFGLLDANCNAICISPGYASDRTTYVCTSSGLFYTPNDGYSWRSVDFAPQYPEFLSITASTASGCLYAGTANGEIYLSTDQGRTWLVIYSFSEGQPINGLYLDPQMAHNPTLVALAGQHLYRSEDGGNTFNPWQSEHLSGQIDITALSAPAGFAKEKQIWMGSSSGVMEIQI